MADDPARAQLDRETELRRATQKVLRERYPFLEPLIAEGEYVEMVSRGPASDILKQVAEYGSWGGYPADIPLETVGAALRRICSNAPETGMSELARIVEGWLAAEHYKSATFP